MSEVPIKHFWATPTVTLDMSPLQNRIIELQEALTIATQRAEAAEAENERLRKAWQSADTTAQALSMNAGYIDVDGLRVGVHMVRSWLERMRVFEEENETLRAERDALRKVVRTHVETVSRNIHHESGCPWFDNRKRCACGTQPAADALLHLLDAALAVQP